MDSEPVAAYVLVDIGPHDVEVVRQRLLSVDGVRLAHSLLGPNDIICYIWADTLPHLQDVLDKGVRQLIDDGLVERTETRIVLMRAPKEPPDLAKPPRGSAWIFADISAGSIDSVVGELESIAGVEVVHGVVGLCDLILFVRAEDWDDLMEILDGELRHVSGIARTDTRLVLMQRVR